MPVRQVYERLFVQETLLDIVLDAVDLYEVAEEVDGEPSRRWIEGQRAKRSDVKERLARVTRMAEEVYGLIGERREEAVALFERVGRAYALVSSVDVTMSWAIGKWWERKEEGERRRAVQTMLNKVILSRAYAARDAKAEDSDDVGEQEESGEDENDGSMYYGSDSQDER